jgi:invasion protein IalB
MIDFHKEDRLRIRLFVRIAWLLVAGIALMVSTARAQTPQRTTATYDDWTVSCAMESASGKRTCEMVQMQTAEDQPEGQARPVGQVTISRANDREPLKIFFQVVPNVWLDGGIKFGLDDKDIALIATFRWCLPNRCLADAILNDTAVRKMRARMEPGKAEFKDAAEHDASTVVSFKGFASAMDAMARVTAGQR